MLVLITTLIGCEGSLLVLNVVSEKLDTAMVVGMEKSSDKVGPAHEPLYTRTAFPDLQIPHVSLFRPSIACACAFRMEPMNLSDVESKFATKINRERNGVVAAARIATIAMTISISMRVNPLFILSSYGTGKFINRSDDGKCDKSDDQTNCQK